jgi:hypothetical protein
MSSTKKNVTFVFHFSSFSSPLPFKIALFFVIQYRAQGKNRKQRRKIGKFL